MKTQTKTILSLTLFLFIYMSLATVGSALTLTAGAVGSGTVGSALDGGVWTSTDVGFGTRIESVDLYDTTEQVSYDSFRLDGYSDAGITDMGVATSTITSNSNVALTSTFGNSFTIGSGDTGSAYGTSTQLTVDIRLDGSTNTSADRNSEADSIARLSSVFQLWDTSQADSDFDPYLLKFNADLWNQTQTSGDGSLVHDYNWRWRVQTGFDYSTRDTVIASDSGDSSYDLTPNEVATCLPTPENPNCASFFDTGLLTFYVDTFVGAELTTFGWMQAGSNLTGVGSSATDFLNTFGATITAADGIELAFAVTPPADTDTGTGSAPVPEPSTALLLGSGLVGLAWYGRKRKKT